MQPKKQEVVIVGGGPAALSAAIYSQRAGHPALLIEKEGLGGQIATSPYVENYPSQKGLSGLELANKMVEQATSLGAEIEPDEVLEIQRLENSHFLIKTTYSLFEAKAVLLATGVEHKKLQVKGEEELLGKGIFYCAVCDSFQAEGKKTVVIGDGNSALQYALYLAKFAKEVVICRLFDKFFGEESLINKVESTPNIHILSSLKTKQFIGHESLEGILFEDKNKQDFLLDAKACFIAIGQKANNDRFKNLVDLDEHGYIKTNEEMETSTPGIYAAGDCRKKNVRQVVTAVNDGAIAALSIHRYLENIN